MPENDSSSLHRTCIVGGCGHVGLPLGLVLADRGHRVTLVDTDPRRVELVRAGTPPFLERGAEELLPRALAEGRLAVETTLERLADHDVVVVTIGTPVDQYLDPEIGPFDRALDELLAAIAPGSLLVLRSTVFPGVTDRLARRIIARGLDVDLAYCPERVAQGHAIEEIASLPQLVSGVTPKAEQRAAAIFESVGARVIRLSPIEAELAKLIANSYRYVNFAISNQFYMIAHRFGADFSRIHAAVCADYPRLAGLAPAGFSGGPCLLKDTLQLAAFNHADFGLGNAAMLINEGLPAFVVEQLAATRDLSLDAVGILGMAFKGNSDDTRDSLSYKLRKILRLRCREVLCTDPHVQAPEILPLDEVLARSTVLILGACHDEYRDLTVKQPLVDVFGFMRNPSQ